VLRVCVFGWQGIEDFDFKPPPDKLAAPSASFHARPMKLSHEGRSYSIMGDNPNHIDKVTTPLPFQSMEMDTLLRQHNADERERAKALEAAREAARRERRFQASQRADITEVSERS
jgi:hypothetical protein